MPNKAKNMYTDAILNVIDEYKLIVDKYKGKEIPQLMSEKINHPQAPIQQAMKRSGINPEDFRI